MSGCEFRWLVFRSTGQLLPLEKFDSRS
jgi:hypothetical protein